MNEFKVLSMLIAFLYVVYETDAVQYYLGLINKKFFKTLDYSQYREVSPIPLTYLEYLARNKNFFLTLLACPICLSAWLVLIANIVCNLGIGNLGYEFLGTVFGYSAFKWIMKKLYE